MSAVSDTAGPRPRTAMVLAAGLATRMRPLSADRPKAMIEVGGRPMIDHILDRLEAAGIERVTVNLHHQGEVLARHLGERRHPEIAISHEETLRGTAGGVRAVLDRLGPDPFYVINGDIVWLDGPERVLDRLARLWDDRRMDALAVVVPTVYALGIGDHGDFELDPMGLISWPGEGVVAPFAYAGMQLVHPRLFDGLADGPADMAPCWRRAVARERMAGLVFDGTWAHVGTPAALRHVGRLLEGQELTLVRHGD